MCSSCQSGPNGMGNEFSVITTDSPSIRGHERGKGFFPGLFCPLSPHPPGSNFYTILTSITSLFLLFVNFLFLGWIGSEIFVCIGLKTEKGLAGNLVGMTALWKTFSQLFHVYLNGDLLFERRATKSIALSLRHYRKVGSFFWVFEDKSLKWIPNQEIKIGHRWDISLVVVVGVVIKAAIFNKFYWYINQLI